MSVSTITKPTSPATIASAGKARSTEPLTLAQAMTAVDTAGSANGRAVATLASIVLARFTQHATALAWQVVAAPGSDPIGILPKTSKSEVLASVWQDATGSRKAPATESRTASQKAVGQYLSRFARVATNMAYGLPGVADLATATESVKAIAASESDSRESAATIAARAAQVAYLAWLSGQTQDVRQSFKSVETLLTSSGRDHGRAFVAYLTARLDALGE